MRSIDNLNLVPKHSMTSVWESPCLIIAQKLVIVTVCFASVLTLIRTYLEIT